MRQLVILCFSSWEKTVLTHVEVETFQATVSEMQIFDFMSTSILTILYIYMYINFSEMSHLNPMIGYSLHMLHLAWCLAVSAADSLCNTGSQTILCGSCCSQLKKCTASISFLSFPAFSKQLRTLGSIFEPPNAATSPSCLGTCMQSCNRSPNFRWSTNLLGSAIKRNKSVNNIKKSLLGLS